VEVESTPCGNLISHHQSAVDCHAEVTLRSPALSEERKIRPPVNTKWLKIFKRRSEYDYVAELSCCAKSEQNRLTQYCWGNRGSLIFFYSHTHSQSNKFFHLAYRSQLWKDLKHLWLKTRGFTPRCAFLGYR